MNRNVILIIALIFIALGMKAQNDDALQHTLDTVIDNLINNMVYVEGGTFMMGSFPSELPEIDTLYYDNEIPAHEVTLSSFRIGRYEVTQEEWEAVMGENPSHYKGAKRPVEGISWNDCQIFIRKLNELTKDHPNGGHFRLPTEAEWEYAARGGKNGRGYKYAGSNELDFVAWYSKRSYKRPKDNPDYGTPNYGTHPVGQKSPNELGLYDMSGNVSEWCQDWYDKDFYKKSPKSNPCNDIENDRRILRGGNWGLTSWDCRVTQRSHWPPELKDGGSGIRLAQ